jgi:GntR family transcriptional regulator
MSDLTAQFSIVTGSAEPIYRQMVEQVKRRIAAGQWLAGDEMPSVRELAQALAVNPMTVSKAYSLLEAQGVLERRRGLSMVVAEGAAPSTRVADRAELLRPTLERAATEAHQLGLSPARALALFKTVLQETHPGEST